ncbi:hypothetical protein RBA63_22595 [Brenneria goodwinii]|uniref:hypothetical protein n=1 Tax=Brenneria goodwinii TaxID=1109412 RepID=UPI0036EC9B27
MLTFGNLIESERRRVIEETEFAFMAMAVGSRLRRRRRGISAYDAPKESQHTVILMSAWLGAPPDEANERDSRMTKRSRYSGDCGMTAVKRLEQDIAAGRTGFCFWSRMDYAAFECGIYRVKTTAARS